jgi:hypothetical protein
VRRRLPRASACPRPACSRGAGRSRSGAPAARRGRLRPGSARRHRPMALVEREDATNRNAGLERPPQAVRSG